MIRIIFFGALYWDLTPLITMELTKQGEAAAVAF